MPKHICAAAFSLSFLMLISVNNTILGEVFAWNRAISYLVIFVRWTSARARSIDHEEEDNFAFTLQNKVSDSLRVEVKKRNIHLSRYA